MKHSGILRIGFKLLVNDKAKFSALLIGITFAVFLMMQMTAMFAGILNRAYSTVTNIGASMWIMDPAVNTATSSIPLPDYLWTRCAAWTASAMRCHFLSAEPKSSWRAEHINR
jgi:putative ABC transport system permease protein